MPAVILLDRGKDSRITWHIALAVAMPRKTGHGGALTVTT